MVIKKAKKDIPLRLMSGHSDSSLFLAHSYIRSNISRYRFSAFLILSALMARFCLPSTTMLDKGNSCTTSLHYNPEVNKLVWSQDEKGQKIKNWHNWCTHQLLIDKTTHSNLCMYAYGHLFYKSNLSCHHGYRVVDRSVDDIRPKSEQGSRG